MNIKQLIQEMQTSTFNVKLVRPGIYQLIAPLFHDDGDMMNIYIEEVNSELVKLSDHGMSLMRLSYLFDIDSDKKRRILDDIVLSRGAALVNGGIELYIEPEDIYAGIMGFSQIITEVCNMEILSRETIASLFYENLKITIQNMNVESMFIQDYQLKGYSDIIIDYAFIPKNGMRPLYLFGIKDTNKAQQTTICCLTMTIDNVPHKSVAVFENIDSITNFARNSLLNAAGKVFPDLGGFTKAGESYLQRELKLA